MTEHEHTWVPDGESWTERDHEKSCGVPKAETLGEKGEALRSCECGNYRVRRYTCHCGEMKEVRYDK